MEITFHFLEADQSAVENCLILQTSFSTNNARGRDAAMNYFNISVPAKKEWLDVDIDRFGQN